MNQNESKKPKQRTKKAKRNLKVFTILLLAVAFVITYFSVLAALTPKRYDISVGEAAKENIVATRNVVDEASTNALKEQRKNSTQNVYSIDELCVDELLAGAQDFMDSLVRMRSDANMLKDDYSSLAPSAAEWNEIVSAANKAALRSLSTPNLDDGELCNVLAATTTEIQLLKDIVLPKLETHLRAGLLEDNLESVRAACVREVNATTGLSSGLKDVAEKAINEYMQITQVINEDATLEAQAKAMASVEDVIIKKGETIVAKDAIVTQSQYVMLLSLELVQDDQATWMLDIGLFVYLLVAFLLFGICLWRMHREIFLDTRKMIIVMILISLTALLSLLCSMVDARMAPVLLAIMLCALLVGERPAMLLSILIAFIVSPMAGGKTLLLNNDAFILFAQTLAGGFAAVLALKRTQSRGSLIAAGAVGGAASGIVCTALMLVLESTAVDILLALGWIMGSAMISALLVVGSLSIWENLFDVATQARLSELTNTNHPLLKQLLLEAPGTYQHSVMVASLAEGAAQRIGADSLLARVGAYFHDVGKLRRPLYFKENQKPNENIHDKLPAQESATSIIAHQKDGVALLTRHKLPSAVIRIAAEHHGNSLMTYFYYKATQVEGNADVAPKTFHYTGNRPSTKEHVS